jgi:hypothetical protein
VVLNLGALLVVIVIMHEGCSRNLAALLTARLVAADIVVRVAAVRDATAGLSVRVDLGAVTLLVVSVGVH